MEFQNKSITKYGPNGKFPYQCSRCGKCCHNVSQSIPLSSLDLFNIAKHLEMRIEDVAHQYAEPVNLGYGNIMFTAKTLPIGDACIFYRDNACTIHRTKPLACRLYPMNIAPADDGGLEYYLVSTEHHHHYTGTLWKAESWMNANFSADYRAFMTSGFAYGVEHGKLSKGIVSNPTDLFPNSLMAAWIYLTYFRYELDAPFQAQYIRNMEALGVELLRAKQKAETDGAV